MPKDTSDQRLKKLEDFAFGRRRTPVAVAPASGREGVGRMAALDDHAHAHGSQPGGELHAVATTKANGFMSSDDKERLDGLAVSAVPVTRQIATTAPLTGGGDLSADRTLGITNATPSTAGAMSAADKTKLDGLPASAVPTTRLVNTNAPLTGGGALSADLTLDINNATPGADGAMSAADKTKLDGLPASAVPTTRQVIAGAGLTGGGALSADIAIDISSGDGSIIVNPNNITVGVINDTQHGSRGNGTLHTVATSSVAGFQSASDKAKQDWDEGFELVAAAGTTAGTATVLTKRSALVNSSGGSNTGVRLTAYSVTGRRQTVFNGALNNTIVYPPAGVTICDNTGAAVLTSWTLPPGATATFLWDISTFVSVESQSGTLVAANLSGTNTGDVTLNNVGASPNAQAASLTGQALTLQPASASFPGVVTTSAQVFTGAKTFQSANTTFAIGSTTAQAEVESTAATGVAVLGFKSNGAQRALIGANQAGNLVLDASSDTLLRFAGSTKIQIGTGTTTFSTKPVWTVGSMTGNGNTQAAGQVPSLTDQNAAYVVSGAASNNAITLNSSTPIGTVLWFFFSTANGTVFPPSGGQFVGLALNAGVTTTRFMIQVIKYSAAGWGYIA